ncbi:DAK2 domain-containing protein [Corynebacterium frankenforstense]|uniref:DAK2 domain-containing protein n=1 Tax=Corynebacterium frankenforstense TaxID=1230998 RepID=UPI0026ED4E1F|nr:DAK2 domain-containing protein [Corynebacterium frankenforstense]
MTAPARLDGETLLRWSRRAVAELASRRREINELNVFPVPDADTGSNMAHTMSAALEEAEKLDEHAAAPAVAAALATGAVKGARGNSGLVLSQVLRGIAEAAGRGELDGTAVAEALRIALVLVDRAISEPVEGTVITVLRAAGIAAAEQTELADVVRAAVAAARTALAQTPSQLKALRDAGVVDAGGRGFVILLESLAEELAGAEAPEVPAPESHGRPAYLEVMCHISGTDLDALEERLAAMGDSLVLARDGDHAAGVHIHTRAAGSVIEALFAAGTVTALRLEVLPEQTQAPRRAVIAVTPAGPVADLYREAGAAVVTPPAPEGDDDIVSAIARTVRTSGADEVILLPNGLLNHRELVSVERAGHAFEQEITLLPTARLLSGIAALAVHDPGQPVGVAAYVMQEAAAGMRTAVLVRAESARLTPAGPCARDDVLVLEGETVTAVAEDVAEAVESTCRRLLSAGGEQVSLLLHESVDLDELELAERLGVDVMAFPAGDIDELVEIGVE